MRPTLGKKRRRESTSENIAVKKKGVARLKNRRRILCQQPVLVYAKDSRENAGKENPPIRDKFGDGGGELALGAIPAAVPKHEGRREVSSF